MVLITLLTLFSKTDFRDRLFLVKIPRFNKPNLQVTPSPIKIIFNPIICLRLISNQLTKLRYSVKIIKTINFKGKLKTERITSSPEIKYLVNKISSLEVKPNNKIKRLKSLDNSTKQLLAKTKITLRGWLV